MISNFKAPNLKGPRYREKVLGLLNINLINEFKEKYPIYNNIDKDKLKNIIKLYNKKLWEEVINNRSGVELPDSLGYLFIGTCPSAKGVNTNYALSKQYGKVLQNMNLDTDGNIVAVAAHEDGVKIFNLITPSELSLASTIECTNAWAVAIKDNLLFIGDESNIRIVNISNINNPELLSIVNLSNAIKDIIIDQDKLYVALGSDGVALYEINGNSINHLDTYNTNTLANRLSAFNGKVAVADWDDVEVLEWNGSELNLVGYKNTGNRTMAVAADVHDYIYSIEWASVQSFEYGQINGPDIDLNTWELNHYFHYEKQM